MESVLTIVNCPTNTLLRNCSLEGGQVKGVTQMWMDRPNGFSHKPDLNLELLVDFALELTLVFINCPGASARGLKC
jgi:hypothetical protein